MGSYLSFLSKIVTKFSHICSCLTSYLEEDIFSFPLQNIEIVNFSLAPLPFYCAFYWRELRNFSGEIYEELFYLFFRNFFVEMHDADIFFSSCKQIFNYSCRV